MIAYLREQQVTLTWDQAVGTLRAKAAETTRSITVKASYPGRKALSRKGGERKDPPVARR